MLPKKPIFDLLTELQTLYDSPHHNSHKIYYSKMALIELCGWIELCVDKIASDLVNSNLNKPKNIDFAKKQIIDNTYGFDYEKNLRPIFMKLIGLINIEIIEDLLDSTGEITLLKSQLNNLVSLRNPAAHTSIVGVTHTYNAPSTMINYLNNIYDKLNNLQIAINLTK